MRTTPFHPKTSALCESYAWKEWAGYAAVCSYDNHSEAEYFRVFDDFLEGIADEPRLSEEHFTKRPFYFSDQLPFALITRLWASGSTQRND